MGIKPLAAVLFWFRERARDLFMWPFNLVRDFPARSGRLLVTLWRGLVGVARFLPEAGRAVARGEGKMWLRGSAGLLAAWFYRFSVHLFDLVGGPEIALFFMHLITTTTPLTDEELAILFAMMGPDKMRYRDVRVAEGGLLDLVFKHNGNLAFTTWTTINFPRNQQGQSHNHTRANRGIFVHELTHVYQYERVGTRYMGEAIYMLIKTKRDCYDYGFVEGLKEAIQKGKLYSQFNREQQAQIVQDYFNLKRRGSDVTVHEKYVSQMRQGIV